MTAITASHKTKAKTRVVVIGDANVCSMDETSNLPASRHDDISVIADVISPQGHKVEITERKWAYVQRHVEMRGELELLLTAIRQPHFQEPDPHPGRERYWLRAQRPFRFRWLRVVVQFEGDVHHIVTAFGQDNDPEGLRT